MAVESEMSRADPLAEIRDALGHAATHAHAADGADARAVHQQVLSILATLKPTCRVPGGTTPSGTDIGP